MEVDDLIKRMNREITNLKEIAKKFELAKSIRDSHRKTKGP